MMITTDEMRDAIASINERDTNSDEMPLYQLNYEIMRFFSTELHFSLTNHRADMRYYFSDSTFDEYSNPIFALQTCDQMLSAIYECDNSDINNDAFISEYLDMISALCNYDDDILETMNSISDAIASIRERNTMNDN